jgi:opacity protein-like surface antigen
MLRKKPMLAAAFCAIAIAGASASAAFAGEITGNGKPKPVNGNSPCAFSGQEDLQFTGSGTKGDPAHSQNWGHVKQDTGALGGANSTDAFGFEWGCNAHIYGLKSGNSGP